MPKVTLSIEAQCRKCGSTVFEFPDEKTNDPLAKCGKCGNVLGPVRSIYEKIRTDAHTSNNVKIVVREIPG